MFEFSWSFIQRFSCCALFIRPIHTVLTNILYFAESFDSAFVNAIPADLLTDVGTDEYPGA